MLVTVDTSVFVAILSREPGWERLAAVLSSTVSLVAAASVLECFMVTRNSLQEDARTAIEEVLLQYNFRVVEFGIQHVELAQNAYVRFGKGNHPARLNFGDCIVYATAKHTSTPLLFLGNDFSQTDVEVLDWKQN
jgi:ribonuclease VapC